MVFRARCLVRNDHPWQRMNTIDLTEFSTRDNFVAMHFSFFVRICLEFLCFNRRDVNFLANFHHVRMIFIDFRTYSLQVAYAAFPGEFKRFFHLQEEMERMDQEDSKKNN